jgi:hypothetical protein
MRRLSTAPHRLTLAFAGGKVRSEDGITERVARQHVAWCVYDNMYVGTRQAAAKLADSVAIGEDWDVYDRDGHVALTITIEQVGK